MTDQATLASATLSGRYTELPKIRELRALGIKRELISTYAALTDYVNNETGLCYPHMETLARTLGCNVRTIGRHLHELATFGVIEFVQRLRDDSGRYRGWLYRIFHTSATAHRRQARKRKSQEKERQKGIQRSQRRRQRFFKKQSNVHGSTVPEDVGTNRENNNPPNPPTGDHKEGYGWFFGDYSDPEGDERHREEERRRRDKEANRHREGYEWFFR